jgi:hypothetical protein
VLISSTLSRNVHRQRNLGDLADVVDGEAKYGQRTT